nr:FimD/PapC N-terminal domain-containing protein [Cronobacter dublinensis]
MDLSQFSKRGYIMPGDYTFTIKVNQNQLEEQPSHQCDGDTIKETVRRWRNW